MGHFIQCHYDIPSTHVMYFDSMCLTRVSFLTFKIIHFTVPGISTVCGGQSIALESQFFVLSQCGWEGLKSSHQAWRQAPLITEPCQGLLTPPLLSYTPQAFTLLSLLVSCPTLQLPRRRQNMSCFPLGDWLLSANMISNPSFLQMLHFVPLYD